SFIGTSKVTMTTLNQVKSMYDYLKDNGIVNQTVNLQGWSNDGNILKTPYRMSLVQSDSDFSSLSKHIKNDQNLVFIENNYVMGTNESARVSYNNDLALGMNKIRLTFRSIGLNDRNIEYRYILPEKSLEFAKQDLQTLKQME